MKLYKLTTQEHTTYGDMLWKVGKTNKVKRCDNPQLCSHQVIHAYKNKNLALLLNPIHANIDEPVLWECAGNIVVEDFGKVGVFSLKANKILTLPKWYASAKRTDVIVQFAILCAEAVLEVYEKKYPDDKRPRVAIEAAKEYLKTKTKSAAYAANAARAAADAAYAAHAAHAAYAAYAVANAAHAAAHAAHAAARAAAYAAARAAARAADAVANAAYAAADIDFCTLADKAVRMTR